MPYRIEYNDGKYDVVKKDTGELIAHHDTAAKAEAQIRLLEEKENENENEEVEPDQEDEDQEDEDQEDEDQEDEDQEDEDESEDEKEAKPKKELKTSADVRKTREELSKRSNMVTTSERLDRIEKMLADSANGANELGEEGAVALDDELKAAKKHLERIDKALDKLGANNIEEVVTDATAVADEPVVILTRGFNRSVRARRAR